MSLYSWPLRAFTASWEWRNSIIYKWTKSWLTCFLPMQSWIWTCRSEIIFPNLSTKCKLVWAGPFLPRWSFVNYQAYLHIIIDYLYTLTFWDETKQWFVNVIALLLTLFLAEIMCPSLDDPMFGVVQLTGRTIQSKALYSCLRGYRLEGAQERECLLSGRWSGPEPVCSG